MAADVDSDLVKFQQENKHQSLDSKKQKSVPDFERWEREKIGTFKAFKMVNFS